MAETSRQKKGLIIRIVAVIVLLAAVGFLYAYASGIFRAKEPVREPKKSLAVTTETTEPAPPPPPPTYVCPLCGETLTDRSLIDRRPILAKIENSPNARPQSALNKAEVVYEFLAEGGITRFAAIFLSHDATVAGPIRSARFADAVLSNQYDALFVYCGGSSPVLAAIRRAGVTDLGEFRYSSQAYWRDRSRRRPHNLYTSTEKIRAVARQQGFERPSRIRGFRFRDTTPTAQSTTPTVVTVRMSDINISVWKFDPATNTYLRFHGSRPHLDRETGEQIRTRNLIIMYVVQQAVPGVRDSHRNPVYRFILEGTGKAIVFRDGIQIVGTWKATRDNTPQFFDASGQEIELNPGNTWIEVLPIGRTYTVR